MQGGRIPKLIYPQDRHYVFREGEKDNRAFSVKSYYGKLLYMEELDFSYRPIWILWKRKLLMLAGVICARVWVKISTISSFIVR